MEDKIREFKLKLRDYGYEGGIDYLEGSLNSEEIKIVLEDLGSELLCDLLFLIVDKKIENKVSRNLFRVISSDDEKTAFVYDRIEKRYLWQQNFLEKIYSMFLGGMLMMALQEVAKLKKIKVEFVISEVDRIMDGF